MIAVAKRIYEVPSIVAIGPDESDLEIAKKTKCFRSFLKKGFEEAMRSKIPFGKFS